MKAHILRVLLPLFFLLAAALPAQVSAQSAIEGDWILVLVSPEGENQIPLTISQDGSELTAELSVEVPQGESGFSMTGTLDGSNVTWSTVVDYQGMDMPINLSGELSGDEMSGIADYGGLAQGTWEAERVGA